MTTMFIKTGRIVQDRRRPLAKGVAIVVGPGRVDGEVRICRWRGGRQHWSGPTTVGQEQLVPVSDWTLMPLTAAKRLAAAAFERNYLVRAMEAAGGSLADAAQAASVDRSNFRRLLQRHGLVRAAAPRRAARRYSRWGKSPAKRRAR